MGQASALDGDFTSDDFWWGTHRPLEQATGLQPVAYTDHGFFEVEQDRLFGRAWVAVGSAADVAEPGRLLVRTVGGTSVASKPAVPATVACHLRAAATLRPGVPERLGQLLGNMQERLVELEAEGAL